MMPWEPYDGRELINLGRADRLLVRSDTYEQNKLREEDSKETSGRRERTCKGLYRTAL